MTHDFIMPVGPQSPAMKEPMLIKLGIEGNYIQDVELRLGYTHKGIEKLFEGKTPDQAMYLASRICGICSISHERGYIRTIEDMMKIKLEERVKLIRTILFELERISSHMLWTGYMMHEIGYDTLFQYFWREREKVLDLFEKICGNRIHKNICKIGSLRYDMKKEDEELVLKNLESVEPELRKYLAEIKGNHVIKKRLKGVGIISKQTAKKWSLVGPNARASGVDNDVRKLDPYDSYADIKFNTIIGKKEDSFERTVLRINEIFEAISIVRQCIEKLPKKGIKKFQAMHTVKDLEGTARVEAPRGELFYFLKFKGNVLERAKVRTPTFNYIKILEKLLPGVEIGDVPVIVASIDPCFSCMERVMVVKEGKKEWLTEAEFRSKYICMK